jgi:hypothetical protein
MKNFLYALPFYGIGFGLISLIPNLDGQTLLPLWGALSLLVISGTAEAAIFFSKKNKAKRAIKG